MPAASQRTKAELERENARLLTELRESLDRQTATAEVLRTIASAPAEAERALDTIATVAARLFAASDVNIMPLEGGVLRHAATFGELASAVESAFPNRPLDASSIPGTAILERRPFSVADLSAPGVRARFPATRLPKKPGSVVAAPLLREGEAIGAIVLVRDGVRPFTEMELAQVQNFADQAVIAIENARLLGELREALEFQTATSDVLKSISHSTFDVDPVLQTLVETATRLCRAASGVLFRKGENGIFRFAAGYALDQAYIEHERRTPVEPGQGSIIGRTALAGRTVQILDVMTDPVYEQKEGARILGVHSMLGVPLIREGEMVGALGLARTEVEPFSDRQIELVATFADQAVIAIENARLLTELREALERQTATSDILRAIASTPGEVEGTLRQIAETTQRLIGAAGVTLRIADTERQEFKLFIGVGRGAEEVTQQYHGDYAARYKMRARTLPWTVILENRQIHIPDLDNLEPEFSGWPGLPVTRAAGIRTTVGTPLRCQDSAIGAMVVLRDEHKPFVEDELKLLQSFADQAAIAIENARLLTELRESLDRRTAIAEVLKVISSSPGELQPVFQEIVSSASHLCEAGFSVLQLFDGKDFRMAAVHGAPPGAYSRWADENIGRVLPAGPHTVTYQVANSRRTVHIEDYTKSQAYIERDPLAVVSVELAGMRTVVGVPIIADDKVLGIITVHRLEVRPFTEAQIGLVENFSQQAVIAIENARLLEELREARDSAERALVDLRAAQANLIQAEKMASLGQLTAGIAHEIKNPLNFVNNFAGLSVELLDELKEAQAAAAAVLDAEKRAEIDETIELLTGNLAKIAEHGKRADGIVKSMLAHSRGGSSDRQEANLNALVEEALNLAYHGARAQDQSFNITLECDLDPEIGPIEVVPQELTRVFLNLFGNGFYAANKRRREEGDGPFSPTLKVTTREANGGVEVHIRDNGVGIPSDHLPRLFEPFFTTKPTGEGTGLGLSISYEIVTRQHGGEITVKSEPGNFTEFTVRIPRRA